MAPDPLPPPLIVEPGAARAAPGAAAIRVSDGAGCDPVRATAFGAVLAGSRARRGLGPEPIELYAAAGGAGSQPPPAGRDEVWLPHLFCWRSPEAVSLAWERSAISRLDGLVGADADAVSWWADRPQLLLRLGRLAAATGSGGHEQHLSVRWLLANEAGALAALAAVAVEVEHVSLHVGSAEEERVAQILVEALGLVEIPRPRSIAVPGRWLQCGNARVHLNSRPEKPEETGFPGTAPNHVCFAVADIEAAERALREQGVTTARAGSLRQPQVWFRLPGGAVVELQPRIHAG